MDAYLLCHQYTAPSTAISSDWLAIITSPSNQVFVDKFVSKGAKRTCVMSFKRCRKSKRRRAHDESVDKLIGSPTVGPMALTVSLPDTLQEGKQKIVNALASMLPIESKINLFGFWHSVILVGCFYRHENLCWILLNRLNHRLYITSHFIADSLHLFNELRSDMQLAKRQRDKKWTRQGVNDALCIFQSGLAMQQNQPMKMNTLPRSVLKFTHTTDAMAEVVAFLKGTGRAGQTIERFTRRTPLPPGFNAFAGALTETTCGWKVFRTSGVNGCRGTLLKPCTCSRFIELLKQQGFSYLSPSHAATQIMTILPSSLDKESCAPIYAHYSPFIEHVKNNPKLLYFPQGDVYSN